MADKVKLTGVVYGILEEVMEKGTLNAFSYEDMLDELASKDQVAGHSHILFTAILPCIDYMAGALQQGLRILYILATSQIRFDFAHKTFAFAQHPAIVEIKSSHVTTQLTQPIPRKDLV